MGEAIAEFAIPAGAREEAEAYTVHPVALDACVQAVAAAMMSLEPGGTAVALPAGLERLQVTGDCRGLAVAHARILTGGSGLRASFRGFDREGKLLLLGEGLIFRTQTPVPDGGKILPSADWLYEFDWIPLPGDAKPLELKAGDRWLLFGAEGETQALSSVLAKEGIAALRGELDASEARIATAPISDVAYVAPQQNEESGWAALRDCLKVAQAIARDEQSTPPRFWLITHGAQGPGLSHR